MNTDHELDRLLTAWLMADAPMREPESLLGTVLERTARTKRRPAWRIPERWIPMSAISTRFASSTRVPLRTVGAVALLILALVVGAVLIAGSRQRPIPPPFGPANNGRIAYSVGGDIVTADAPGSAPTTIVGGAAFDSGPIFSPDGTRIVFVRGQMDSAGAELWTVNADGSDARRVAAIPYIGWAEWSPRSDVVAVTLDGEPSTIRLVASDGSGSTEIRTGLVSAESLIFRPSDGSQLTFRGRTADGTWGLYLIGRDGAAMQRLALDPGFASDPFYGDNSDNYFFGPAWSPDGTRLLYYTLEPDPTSDAGPGYRIHIADVSASGAVSSERTLEFDRSADDEFAAVWLPRGDGIVFQSLEGAVHRLRVADLAPGSTARDLGVTGADGVAFMISPDGRQVISSIQSGAGSRAISTTDLATLATTKVDAVSDDWSWQRTAP